MSMSHLLATVVIPVRYKSVFSSTTIVTNSGCERRIPSHKGPFCNGSSIPVWLIVLLERIITDIRCKTLVSEVAAKPTGLSRFRLDQCEFIPESKSFSRG